MNSSVIKVNEKDNVAIAIRDLAKGEKVSYGVAAQCFIPQAHKVALKDLPAGSEVIRYGVVLGTAAEDIPAGGWVNEKNLVMAPAPDLDSMNFAQNLVADLPKPSVTTWDGYRNPNGGPAGTRNILAINTTVQCVSGVLNAALARIRTELLPKYSNVDAVIAINHSL